MVATAPRATSPYVDVLPLASATDSSVAGAKAAALARAHQAGLPVLPGFVLGTDAAAAVAAGERGDALDAARAAWADLSANGSRALVVRSSSTIEDGTDSSMAGRFTSLLDVRGWDSFLCAVREVVATGDAVHDGLPLAGRMAVLVQPFIEPEAGGVLFGADPVTGRTDRFVLAAVPGGPDQLVSGEVDGVHLTLSRRGKVLEASGTLDALAGRVRAIAGLGDKAADVFGGPQDVEWAVLDGEPVMLQSRPITAVGADATASGPVYGPGPVAETFPNALAPLELDLWVAPMRDAIRSVLRLTGGAPAKQIDASEVIVAIDGRVAADLELLGLEQPTGARSFFARIDPRPPVRRLRAAWQVGRLRAALPGLARDLVEDIDEQLSAVPPLEDLRDAELVSLLERSQQALRAVHGHEVLAGQLLEHDGAPVSAAAEALRVLAEHRDSSLSATELVARHPVLLSLVPPTIGGAIELPPAPATLPPAGEVSETEMLREALRLRVRWIQELMAQAALVLGGRLQRSGRISRPEVIRAITFDRLRDLVGGDIALVDPPVPATDVAPLPARFRLAEDGSVVAVRRTDGDADGGGRGAGGGRGSGVVLPADSLPSPGAVLVVRTLDPSLAPMLPGLRGLVAETGSVLSHLAILARELGVPTVVGVEDAVRRFGPGTEVVVDGSTGEVSVVASSTHPTQEVAA
ncbi:MAG TPA: PEP/pyruvate-binding domain-containing protein [Acidimicrobiia bacterium]|nr:PEP/pyruvate-binding domain-containing protein [Acidimicrobiia bacterium]